MLHVYIQAPVQPTEDPVRIEEAVHALFPDAKLRHQEGRITGTTNSIGTLLKRTGEERVQDAARGALWRGRFSDESGTRFELNKQAAYMGRVNFNEVRHPLGDIVVEVETDDLEALLDKISPPTPAELAQRERDLTAGFRHEAQAEEARIKAMGSKIDEGLDELEAALAAEEREMVDEED